VEGIILGEAAEEFQNDPLSAIFSDIYDKSITGENKKLKLYQSTYESGQYLHERCNYLGPMTYATPWQEKQARRTMVSTLQYIGLDTSIKAIGAYARKLEMTAEDFSKLSTNIVKSYCSRNNTLMSLNTISRALKKYFDEPVLNLIPSIESSPFAAERVKMMSEKMSSRSKEFDLVIKNFRAFCSWGNEVDDYRMLTPYLNNRFIMAFVVKNMLGVQDKIDPVTFKVTYVPSDSTVQVVCKDLICRKDTLEESMAKFPLSAGSTGVLTDLSKLYCHHFKYQDRPQKTIPEVKEWIKSYELEDHVLETSQFISLMTGVPDFFSSIDAYEEIPLLARSSIDERWTKWANFVLSSFSRDLVYEESLKIRVQSQDKLDFSYPFYIDLSVTLGELDRLVTTNDKLETKFELKLSKNFLRSMRTKTKILEDEVDVEGQKKFLEEIGRYISSQLKEKEKLLRQKVWNEDFGTIIAEELVRQVKTYRGTLFDSYQDEMLKVPVTFHYGMFALSYLRYRTDLAAGRLKLNL
jgi:hypothetical protein